MKIHLVMETDSESEDFMMDRTEMIRALSTVDYISALHAIIDEMRALVKYRLCTAETRDEVVKLVEETYACISEVYGDLKIGE